MATLPSFRTWVAGEIVTAAFMNTNIRDAGNFFLSWPVFEGRQTVAQSFINNTPAGVLLDTEDIDTDGGHSTVTNTSRYSPQTAGRFQLAGGIGWAANATGVRNAEFWKNNALINGAATSLINAGAGSIVRCPTRVITAVANGTTDYFELVAAQGSGGNLSTSVAFANDQATFSVRMVGTT